MLWALWFAAKGVPDLDVLVIFVLGTTLTRSAGCAINDYADRDFDGHVERTRHRPLATGALSSKDALMAATVLMLIAFILVLFTNPLTISLSFIAVVLAFAYPFAKRHTYLPQVVLGAAFGFAIPMAYAAQINSLPAQAWWLFATAMIWSVAYDTLYAIADRPDDLKIGLKSSAILFGRFELLIVGALQLFVLIALAVIGADAVRGLIYYSGLLVASGFAIYQLWICRHREPQKCVQAFLNNSWMGMTIFIGLVLDYAVNP
ncbi:MAG: 4-hydroxybenzoate polyprenyltransferase [Pseudomonadales bacterium]|jgi:4-hydroxybenzoate polyprenyltransferase